MCEKKGLRIEVTFRKSQTCNNEAEIRVKVSLKDVGILESKSAVMRVVTELDYWYQEKPFPTASEAKAWAEQLCEQIKAEYVSKVAKFEALDVPDDYVVEC